MKLSTPIYQLKRRAKTMARQDNVPLHVALDACAKTEGFSGWSQLATDHAKQGPVAKICDALKPSDLVLLGARPGQGKTVMGVEIAGEAIKRGQRATFCSLEDTEVEIRARCDRMEVDQAKLIIDTSDDISARYIINGFSDVTSGDVVLVDYLQLLDQARHKPPLASQVHDLKTFADQTGAIVVLISQIDRGYEGLGKTVPDLTDVRLPNAVDLDQINVAVFLHDGLVEMRRLN